MIDVNAHSSAATSTNGHLRTDSLSVVVLTYNEARRIAACLERVQWADEVIVVDSYSTDDTVAIARTFTPHVYQSDRLGPDNPGGYAAQRNFALEQATRDWVFFVDADEHVTPALRTAIERTILQGNPDCAGFYVRRIEHFFGIRTDHTHGEAWLRRIVRRGHGRFGNSRVHEVLEFDGDDTWGYLDGELLHYSKDTVEDYVGTMNRYTSLEAQDRQQRGEPLASAPWGAMVHAFLYRYIRLRSFREGTFGLLMSLMFACYEYLTWAKQWEAKKKAGALTGTEPPARLTRAAGESLHGLWRGWSALKQTFQRWGR